MVVSEARRTSIFYSSADHRHIDDIFTTHIFILKAIGQIPINFRLPRPLHILNNFLGYIYILFAFLQIFCVGMGLLAKLYEISRDGRFEEITDALTMVIIFWFSIYSTFYWCIKRRRLLKLLQLINHNYWHHSLPGLTFVNWHRTYILIKRATITWVCLSIAGVMAYSFTPLAAGERALPLKLWYPFDPMQPYVYELLYVQQLLAQTIMTTNFACGSGSFASLVIIMCGQFDVLYCSIKNLSYYGRLRSGFDSEKLRNEQATLPKPSEDELNQYMYCHEHLTDLSTLHFMKTEQPTLTLTEALRSGVVQCVQLHSFILEACKEFEAFFKHYCLAKSLQVTMQICLLVFIGVGGERSLGRILNSAQYLMLTFGDLFMYCYFGELLGRHSVRCGEAYWRSQWWTHTTAIRKDILIFLINSQSAVRLTAGNLYAMDIARLRAVVTQAFSFFTLLQKLAAKNRN